MIGNTHASIKDKIISLGNIILGGIFNLLDSIVKVITDVFKSDVGYASSGKVESLGRSKGHSGRGNEKDSGELHD